MSRTIMDVQEFEQECAARRESVFAYAYTCCRDVHLSEDIVQETFMIAFKKREHYFVESDFGAWLIAICRNVWFKERGKRQRREKVHPFIEEHAAQLFTPKFYEDDKLAAEEAALRSCLQKLAEVDQDLIQRHFQQEQKYQTIADTVNKSLSWVKVRMHRARKSLLECVQRGLKHA